MWLTNVPPEERKKKPKRVYRRSAWRLHPAASFIWNNWKESRGCCICGYDQHYAAIQLHHVGKKVFQLKPSAMVSRGWSASWRELAKCAVLCGNCHAVLHAGGIDSHDVVTVSEYDAREIVGEILEPSHKWTDQGCVKLL